MKTRHTTPPKSSKTRNARTLSNGASKTRRGSSLSPVRTTRGASTKADPLPDKKESRRQRQRQSSESEDSDNESQISCKEKPDVKPGSKTACKTSRRTRGRKVSGTEPTKTDAKNVQLKDDGADDSESEVEAKDMEPVNEDQAKKKRKHSSNSETSEDDKNEPKADSSRVSKTKPSQLHTGKRSRYSFTFKRRS